MFAKFSESFSPRPLYFARTLIKSVSRNSLFIPAPWKHFDSAVNCQPSYRAEAIIAEARVILFIFLIFFDEIPPIFIENPLLFAENLDFLFF